MVEQTDLNPSPPLERCPEIRELLQRQSREVRPARRIYLPVIWSGIGLRNEGAGSDWYCVLNYFVALALRKRVLFFGPVAEP